ncbi:MAG: sel1 repeat family protein [Xanthomonadaceae bacterium]|nr:sel1 repeat family protein [Xanthomonadaceae bacterium]
MDIRPRFRASIIAFSFLAALSAPVLAAQNVVPPDPVEDPLLITAGFLNHHQDMKYRLLGIEALEEKRYEDAMKYFRRASFFADKPSQGMVAEMYWSGQGVARDPALAYAWMDLAAERGYVEFIKHRERYWSALTPAERERAIQEGQALYARFGDAAAKPRYEHQLRVGRREMTGSRTGFRGNVQIQVPGPAGMQMIEGSKFYDDRYWDAKKYWAWQDRVWRNPNGVRVTIGEIEQIPGQGKQQSRIPETTPEADAVAPEVPDPPKPPPPAPATP